MLELSFCHGNTISGIFLKVSLKRPPGRAKIHAELPLARFKKHYRCNFVFIIIITSYLLWRHSSGNPKKQLNQPKLPSVMI